MIDKYDSPIAVMPVFMLASVVKTVANALITESRRMWYWKPAEMVWQNFFSGLNAITKIAKSALHHARIFLTETAKSSSATRRPETRFAEQKADEKLEQEYGDGGGYTTATASTATAAATAAATATATAAATGKSDGMGDDDCSGYGSGDETATASATATYGNRRRLRRR